MASWLEQVNEDTGPQSQFEPVLDPETGEVLYYRPTGKLAAVPDATPGTPLEKEEIPIPYVSLPDVEKPTLKPPPVYDVTPPEPVPETPAEQLEKLLPPKDTEAELDALLPQKDAFEAAAARVRRRAPARPPEEPPPTPPSDRDFAEAATAPVRFGAAKFLEHPGNLFYGIPAALTGLLADIEEVTPSKNVPLSARRTGEETRRDVEKGGTTRAVSDWLKEASEASKRGVAKATLTEGQKPVTGMEKLGSYLGEYAQPTKGVSAGATIGLAATGAAVRGGLTNLSPEDIPIPSLVTEAKAAPLDPGKAFGPPPGGGFDQPQGPPVKVAPKAGAPAIPAPVQPGSQVVPVPPPMPNVPYAPQAAPVKGEKKEKKPGKYDLEPVAPEGMILPPSDQWTTSRPNLKQRQGRLLKDGTRVGGETDEQFQQRLYNAWKYKEIQARLYSPTAVKTFNAVNGMEHMSETDYRAVTVLGGTLVGMAMTGLFLKKFRKTELPVPRQVSEAAPGTTAISVPSDLARTYDDINAAVVRIANRAGVPKSVVDRLQQLFRIQTRNGARALADSAIVEGKMFTPSFTFQAPASLAQIAKQSTPQSDQYLKTLATLDQLLAKSAVGQMKPGSQSVTVNGMTVQDALTLIKNLEQAHPEVRNIAKANQSWNKAVYDYQYRGEYATITKQRRNELGMSHTNALGPKAIEEGPMISQGDRARRLIKQRLDNEAVGTYIDEVRKVDPSLFTKITLQQLRDNPEWKKNTVSFYRKGVREYYTTDPLLADVLKTDYHLITAWGGNALYATKRMLEATTTGNLAPNFAVTSALRSYWIAKFTTEQGFKAPTAIGSVMAIPEQLLPQLSRSVSRGLEAGSGGMINAVFPQAWTDGLARRLANYYEQSTYAQLKRAGSHRGSVLEQQHFANRLNSISNAFNTAAAGSNLVRGTQHFWNAWKASIEAVHNAPAFNFAQRNIGKEGAPELALRARRLTGDPRTGGEYLGPKGRPIRFESDNAWDQRTADWLVKKYGWTANQAAQAVPWWNATLQGAKRIGEAYLHDPIRFTRSTAMYAMAPAAGMFYFAKWLDKDPNGKSYIDYMLNGRSAYNRQMNFYIPIPGRPVEDGMELTFFHELNPFKRAMEIGLHHMLGENTVEHESPLSMFLNMPTNVVARKSLKEDLWTAAWAFLDTAVIPPMPPIGNFVLGAFGMRGPQGAFGGEAFPVKADPYNQNGGLPTSLELMSRALMGGIGESFGGFYAAATNSPDTLSGLANGIAQVRDINVKKTPLLRDATGILPDRSNNTDLAKNVFDHQKEFNELNRYFKKWTVNEGAVNVKGASKSGEIAVPEQYGLKRMGPGNVGLSQPEPNNPLYIQFMQTFYDRFQHESPNMVKGEDKGGVAFKSLWRNYGAATQKLERLKDVNQGTYGRWQEELNARDPASYKELIDNGVDTTDRRAVVNFYRTMQYDALRVIDYVRRATEMDLSEQAGRPVRLKDIKPYLSPTQNMIEGVSNWLSPAPFMYNE
jgi:hypothetical protein